MSNRTVSSWEYGGEQQHNSTSGSSPVFHSLCATPGSDDHRVARADVGLLAAEPHPARAGREVVDLLGLAVEVLDGLAADRHRRLGERLVDGVARRHAGELTNRGAVGGDERLAFFQTDGLHEALDRVDGAHEAPPAALATGGGACMSLSHEGDACRGSGDGLAGRRDVQPTRDAGGRVGRPAADRRGVLQARPSGDALGGLGALRNNGGGVGRVAQRMHLGRLPVYEMDGEPPVSYGGRGLCGHGRQVVLPATEGDLAREQEGTPEHAGARGHEGPVGDVARALHQFLLTSSR